MCGIFGLVFHDHRGANVNPALLDKMGMVLRHRGPDNYGKWTKGGVGLGHTRLSIIDLNVSGNQPMSNEDGSVWITFNGEIYNFPELRKELEAKGHVFRSHTDTETIVHLWEEEGVNCVDRLRGMFAFAIWDEKAGSLFLARDRFGKKPLFYSITGDRVVFGSEIKAILQDPDFKIEPDIMAIHQYLAYQSVPSPYCAFRGIRKLPPAHCVLLKRGDGEPKRYWRLNYWKKRQVKSERDIAALQEEIIERLTEAVRIRLMSEVPLGAFLSGGLDSSIVTALMSKVTGGAVKTFSIGFEQEEYNELPYARMVAQKYATDHHEYIVTPNARDIFPALVWHYNEPFADSSAIPTYYVCKLARELVTVVLNGDGGDENFAGYPRYLIDDATMAENMAEREAFLRQNREYYGDDAERLAELNKRRLAYYYRITHLHEIYKKELYTPEMKERVKGVYSVDLMLDRLKAATGQEFLDTLLELDFGLYMPDTLMVKVDIASMAHSLESRSPLLDHHFAEFVATIPAGLKLKNGVSKSILKSACEPYLPHDVIYRKKMGFGVPIDHWFRDELKDMVRDVLLSGRAMQRGYFRRQYIESLLDRHQKGGESWQYIIWNLLMLEFWHLMFVDKTMSAPPSAGV